MTNTVLLNSDEHKDIRVLTRYGADLGDNVMCAPTYASEFRSVQAYYPILFQEAGPSGQMAPVALFGLKQNENLFLKNDGSWDAGYVPLMMQRIPFSIGLYKEESGEESRRMVHIDTDHPKVSRDEGRRLFEEHGGATDYLERMSGMLETIHVWNNHGGAFVEALQNLGLLEQVTMSITLEDGTKAQLLGFFTINEDRLNELPGSDIEKLHRDGYLEPIYMSVASISNIRKLVDRKSSQA